MFLAVKGTVLWQLAGIIDLSFQFLGELWASSYVYIQLLILYTTSFLWRLERCGLCRDGACRERKGLWLRCGAKFYEIHGASLHIHGSNWMKTFKAILPYCSFKGKDILSQTFMLLYIKCLEMVSYGDRIFVITAQIKFKCHRTMGKLKQAVRNRYR